MKDDELWARVWWYSTMLIPTIFLCALFFSNTGGCVSKADMDEVTRSEPKVFPCGTNDTFKVVENPTQIGNLGVSRVLVERGSDKRILSVLVVPNRTLEVGAKVELVEVYYNFTATGPKNIIFVK